MVICYAIYGPSRPVRLPPLQHPNTNVKLQTLIINLELLSEV
jgi:hypothetical protein